MDTGHYLGSRKTSFPWTEDEEEKEEDKKRMLISSIPQPETPNESIEFLSRSWSLSAAEVTKALAKKQKQCHLDRNLNVIPESAVLPPQQPNKVMTLANISRRGPFGKWFFSKESINSAVIKKDRERAESAHTHAALSVAGLAAALASLIAAENSNNPSTKTNRSLALASELLASHCIEAAESAGNAHENVASVVRSAVDVRGPSDLMTLTAAAATALRGEAALKARLQKESKKNATISPYSKNMAEANPVNEFEREMPKKCPPCRGELLQHTQKGFLQRKCVSIFIDKKSQVIIRLRSKHVGGAFSKNNKFAVYEVCDETAGWPFRLEKENVEEVCFGLKTAHGLLEFMCKSKTHKQKWVDGVQSLLRRVGCVDSTAESLECLNLNDGT